MSRRYPQLAPTSAFPRDRYGVREYSREAELDYFADREEDRARPATASSTANSRDAAQHRAAVGRHSARAVYQAVVTANVMRRELEQLTCAVDAWDEWSQARAAAREARRPWLLVEWMTDAVVEARPIVRVPVPGGRS